VANIDGGKPTSKIWQTLTKQLEEDLIIALARFIRKMVLAEVIDQTEEQRYER